MEDWIAFLIFVVLVILLLIIVCPARKGWRKRSILLISQPVRHVKPVRKLFIENFAPVSSVVQFHYPDESVRLSEENIQFVSLAPTARTAFQGVQAPIGTEIYFAQAPISELQSIPLSTTIVSPACCPSEYSSSEGCYCMGNAGRLLGNITNN